MSPATRRSILRLFALVFALGTLVVFEVVPRDADARPGGGQTFGGSKSSGGSSSGGSSSGGSKSSGSGSSGGSSRSSSSDNDSSWSKAPSYSSPWSTPTPPPKPAAQPQGRSPHGGSYTRPSPPLRPRGSMLEFFFWIIGGVVVIGGALKLFTFFISRRLEDWVEDGRSEHWESGIDHHIPSLPDPMEAAEEQRRRSARSALELAAKDAEFSFVVFEDFMYALYTALHRARGERTVELFSPYLGHEAKSWLVEHQVDSVENIIVGAMRVDDFRMDEASQRLIAELVFTANYTSRAEGVDQSFYVEEKWQVSRGAQVLSRPPDKARVIGCPHCGAALDGAIAGKCKYCNEQVIDADYDWRVDSIAELTGEPRGPMLVGTTEEVGTDAPTQVAPDARDRLMALMQMGGFAWHDFAERVELVFRTFHTAWTSQELKPVRPFLSDALFDTQRYWVATYKAQDLRNITKDPRITNLELVRVGSDLHFDAITVRVTCVCCDFTLDSRDDVVAGSKEAQRFYSEYWTLIRAAGTSRPSKADSACPSCAAPADKLNMAGVCEACGAKITLGKFDWVLSRIEQDEIFSL